MKIIVIYKLMLGEKNEKRNLIIILSLIVFILIGVFSQKAKDKAEKEREIKNYESSVSKYEEITDLQFLNNDKTLEGFVFIGRKTCSSCRLFVKVINEITFEKEINIKYFDTDKYRNSKYYDEILEKYQIDQVPYMVLVKKDGSFETFDKKILIKANYLKIG